MCTLPLPPLFLMEGGIEPLTNFSKKGGLAGSQFLFNDKKSSSAKIFFSVTTKSLKWKTLTKN